MRLYDELGLSDTREQQRLTDVNVAKAPRSTRGALADVAKADPCSLVTNADLISHTFRSVPPRARNYDNSIAQFYERVGYSPSERSLNNGDGFL